MNKVASGELRPAVQEEVDLFAHRLSDFASRMNAMRDDASATTEQRIREVAGLAIDFFDMIDGIDHQTCAIESVLGGTPEIQDFVFNSRAAIRAYHTQSTD